MQTPSERDELNSVSNGNFPPHIDRRAFFIRGAVIGAASALAGRTWTPEARARQAANEAAKINLQAHSRSRHRKRMRATVVEGMHK